MSGRKPGNYGRGNVRSPPYGRKPSSGTPPGFFALGPWCDVCCKLLVIILFFVSVFTVISTAWDWRTSLFDRPVDSAAASSSYEKVTPLFESPVRVDTGKSTSEKKESGWESSGWESTPKEPTTQKPSEPAIPHTSPHSQTTDPLSHNGPTTLDLSAPIPKVTELTTHHGPTPPTPLSPANTLLPALQKHCNYFPPLPTALSSLFPIDGLPMSNDHDIFAHLINTGLTLYRAPIFNLPLIRSRLLPQARVIASLLEPQILRKNLAASVEGKKEVGEVKKALEEFMNSFPGARFGGKVQRVDGVLERELEGFKVVLGGGWEWEWAWEFESGREREEGVDIYRLREWTFK
ncbi:hypothetical protein HYALB_00005826 [Hymenoscyphus albidus]|uniref:Uncharacterized protein n=1 Tax=Hymenoscyphus albidus TaxID=595503 RepID=A0A9N9LIV5_9HELO|nr:hypothetical protein HYALB_00005826 [Hymenoscyphus albidus]